ncbi:MAG: hypothetical protein U0R64_09115 [Candidatus Nanopelagicales bacterium]
MARRWRMAATLGLLLAVSAPATARATDDYVVPTDPADQLSLPASADLAAPLARSLGIDAQGARFRYALSYVAIPLKGYRLGVRRSQVEAMTRHVSRRMSSQTAERFSYGMTSWTKAPRTTSGRLSCDPVVVNRKYRSYARGLNRPPEGYRDTIAIYVTPARYKCNYAGIALLGGRAIVLNGVDGDDPAGLQDWITAHELGHTLGLEHEASFWSRTAGWTFADPVPVKAREQQWNVYGDYLDLMGQPPNAGYGLPGARLSRWSFSALHLQDLGVLTGRNETVVRTSGRYTLDAVTPDRSGGRMMLSIPVVADGQTTYWSLEFRPASSNATGLRLPEPYVMRGYGVRLLLAGRGVRYPAAMNRVFHVSRAATAQAALPVGQRVRLARTGSVRVVSVGADTATVDITLS